MQQVLETVDLPPIFRSEVRANVVRISYDNRKKLTCEFSKSVLICEQDRKLVPTPFLGSKSDSSVARYV